MKNMERRPKKLLDRVRETIRRKHYSIRTGKSYVRWIRRYILSFATPSQTIRRAQGQGSRTSPSLRFEDKFHNKRHPKDMGAPEIEAFLTHLAVKENVAASTQNQALSALLFLYREVLKQDMAFVPNSIRAQRPKRLPTVLTKEEVQKVIGLMRGTHQLMAKLLYGSGLHLMECVQLRVKDIDFGQRQIVV